MTIIVYRDGVMAADSGGFIGDICVSKSEIKIRRTNNGDLVGASGASGDTEKFFNWVNDGYVGEPGIKNSFGAIVASRDGKIVRYGHDNGEWYSQDQTYLGWAAAGAHAEFVLALIFLGLSAQDIVAHACEHCAWAAGSVQTMELALDAKPDTERAR